jgi:hypothetical protein
MLAPAVTVPQAFPIELDLTTFQFFEDEYSPLSLNAKIFFQHSGGGTVMLPAHRMWGRIESGARHIASELLPIDMAMKHEPDEMSYASLSVQERYDGVMISGSGPLDITGSASIEAQDVEQLSEVNPLQVRLSFGVAGLDRRIEVLATLYRTTEANARKIGWRFKESAANPWSDMPT